MLPLAWRERLTGLLGNDVVAFHTEGSARNFLLSAQELLGLPVDRGDDRAGRRPGGGRPSLPDLDRRRLAARAGRLGRGGRARRRAGGVLRDGDRQLVLRVECTDPSKNIVRGFQAFATMLEDHPELAGKVSPWPCPAEPPGRARVRRLPGRDRRHRGQGQRRPRAEGYRPIDLRLSGDFVLAVAAYTVSDVLMVNALADGMNLVAKEAVVVNRRDSVLALSENTGAHQELGAFAVTPYPFDIQQQADALYASLTMDRGLRRPVARPRPRWSRRTTSPSG